MPATSELYKIPIAERPPHGSWFAAILFPLLFNIGLIGINTAQFLITPLLLLSPLTGGWTRTLFDRGIEWTKECFGRLLILITVLFAPTSIVITVSSPSSTEPATLDLESLIERDAKGNVERINLPDRLVIMANHQAYTDWMYTWILSAYAGHQRGLVILLKRQLKNIPIVGWGMQFFRFIFLSRSWAADRTNLTLALTEIGQKAKASNDSPTGSESQPLLKEDGQVTLPASAGSPRTRSKRNPLWLLIFPEGTITSDEERVKSKRYADKEGIPDLENMLHPRSTGLLFCLRTLLPQIPDLQLLDITIGYPGVPDGKYPQYWYGLLSVFSKSVPPPAVHMHLKLHKLPSDIPSLVSEPVPGSISTDQGLATKDEARAFELWIRERWLEKEARMKAFIRDQRFEGDGGVERVAIRQLRWNHWLDAVGWFGVGSLGIVTAAIVSDVRSLLRG